MTQRQTLPEVDHAIYPTTSWSAKLRAQGALHDSQEPAQGWGWGTGKMLAFKLTFWILESGFHTI